MSIKRKSDNLREYLDGLRDGVPIGLGYLAVSFALGIVANKAGLNAFQSGLASLLCTASAGEKVGFDIIETAGSYLVVALMTLVVNARYTLMSCALSQRIDPATPVYRRLFIGCGITDEIFAVSMGRPGYINLRYIYGAMTVAIPLWTGGTAVGAVAGSLLPARLVSALGVALYGMFLAVIIPPAKKDRIICGLIAVCFAASYGITKLPILFGQFDGLKTVVLTVVLSAAAAILFPKKDEETE